MAAAYPHVEERGCSNKKDSWAGEGKEEKTAELCKKVKRCVCVKSAVCQPKNYTNCAGCQKFQKYCQTTCAKQNLGNKPCEGVLWDDGEVTPHV